MTKKDIVRNIAAELNLSQSVVHEVVQQAFDGIIAALLREQRIELRNFGVFEVKVRAPRRARNPRTNEHLDLPRRLIVSFKPGKEMADRVAELPLDKMKGTLSRHLEMGDGDPAARPQQGDSPHHKYHDE